MLKNYFKKKSKFAIFIGKFAIFIGILIGIVLLLLMNPGTRKDMAVLVIKPTLFINQPTVKSDKKLLKDETYNWQLSSTNGDKIIFDDLKGKVVLVNLWATSCPPCIAEMPDFQKLYNDYGDEMEFLFISHENTDVIKMFLDKKGFSLPSYHPVTQYPADFEINSVPTTFVINKKGEIVISKKGVAHWNGKRMRGILDALIGED